MEVPGSIPELGLATTVVSLSKKLYPHCSSHSAVKPGKYCIRAQLKNSLQADAVLPGEITCQKREMATFIIVSLYSISIKVLSFY